MPLAASRVLRTFRYAVYFDGIDDYVYVGDNPSLRPPTFTVFVYAMYTAGVFDQNYIFRKTGSAPGYTVNLQISSPYFGAGVGFRLRDASLGSDFTVLAPYPSFAWFSAALVYDGSTAYTYLNASLYVSRSMAFDNTKNTNSLYVGYPGGAKSPALVFQALYYSRALSSSEIAWNHNYPDNPIRNGLVLWLQADPSYVKDIDGDGRLEWIDLSGYNNHGKIYGATLVDLYKSPVRALSSVRTMLVAR
jgi:hypothetical protein